MIKINGTNLTIEDVWKVAIHDEEVELDEITKNLINNSNQCVKEIVKSGKTVYGITTGFGAFRDKLVLGEKTQELQRNFLMSHAVGVGDPLPKHIVRALIITRANSLAKGLSGVQVETVQMLCKLLNHRVHPVIPGQGSVGSSGDLAPLAHLGLVTIGLGEAEYGGDILPGGEALQRAGISSINLGPKEGLALTNGANLMTAIGSIMVKKAEYLLEMADAIAALSTEALGGVLHAFDSRIHDARPHRGEIAVAENMRRLLIGSELLKTGSKVQDPYSIRGIPQVHGAIRDVVSYVRNVISVELNSATDNPLIFCTDDGFDILSGGNFHGEPIAFAMDFIGIALSELANISERRLARLVDDKANDGLLPPCLIDNAGFNTGFMIAQYTAASLVSENKVLSHPASVDSIPTSLGFEDHVSMGTIAARKALSIIGNVEKVLGIELLAACQAIDFRRREFKNKNDILGKGGKVLYKSVRDEIPFIDQDVVLYPLLNKATNLVTNEILANKLKNL